MSTKTRRIDLLREGLEDLNARRFDTVEDTYLPDVRFHAPGLGLDLQGRDAMLAAVQDFITRADVHYEERGFAELGPFGLSFVRSTGTIDGQRMAWDLLQVLRFEGDKVAEVWALRGGPPEPAG